jgi:RNA polymerase sigma-70 factor (ECF subfamily)
MSSKLDGKQDEQIVQLITSCQRSLLGYLLGLLGSQELAEDALQETNIVLWQKRREYCANTNFFAWACQIAYFKACNSRKQRHRNVPVFSEVFMQEIAFDIEVAVQKPNQLETFLNECLKLLDDQELNLLDQRYADGATVDLLAASLNQSVRSVYRTLERIHVRLFNCIGEKIKEDDNA